MKQKAVIIGGGVALILWLLTKESSAGESARVDEFASTFGDKKGFGVTPLAEIQGIDMGTIEADVNGNGIPERFRLSASEITMTDSETGACLLADDGSGRPISCAEHDRRVLAAQSVGGLRSEENG